ncbi:MAG: Carbohydrate binding domain protein [candidate division BRC1 bacterium ADurb.BinA364]|nr:MAG: Carbohydrate binding domain protein [candidate division BRC1 bacterium ADurb.BinA364]
MAHRFGGFSRRMPRLRRAAFAASLPFLLFGFSIRAEESASAMFPFVVPGDDVSGGATDLSFLNGRPADQLVAVRDGHFYAGEERIRFWGINSDYDANYPARAEAEMLARRFAKLGLNLIRITHTDHLYAPRGLFDRAHKGEMRIDPAQMDKLDNFIAELKKRGIYVELSIHVSHLPNMGGKGIPDIGDARYGFGSGLPLWNERFIEAEKQFARDYLCHVNAYTGLAYTEEPAVAYVEIINENGLIGAWARGSVKRTWSDALAADLRTAWNRHLRKKYRTTAALREAWAGESEADGGELLRNPGFADGTAGWSMQLVAPYTGRLSASKNGYRGMPCLEAVCDQRSEKTWHVNLQQTGFPIEQDCLYQVSFAAKAEQPVLLRIGLTKGAAPWSDLGLSMEAGLSRDWQRFSERFVATASEKESRILVRLAEAKNKLYFAEFSLRKVGFAGLPEGETLEAGNVAMPLWPADCAVRPPRFASDFVDFLYEVDDRYFSEMHAFLKNDLGCKHPIKGTQASADYSSFFSLAKCDFIDVHGYWQHPRFGSNDREKDWSIVNEPMVNNRGETAAGLAMCRVRGMPFQVSEYGHPAPNTFCAEGIPTVASIAALQDWDGVTLFNYSKDNRFVQNMITSFFEHKSHPVKLVTMPFGALVFRRGDVSPALEETTVGIALDTLKRFTLKNVKKDAGIAAMGVTWLDVFTHRISLSLGSEIIPDFLPAQRNIAVSDTGELTYDLSNKDAGALVVNTARSKAVVGFGAGREFDLGDLVLRPGPTMQNGFSTITASAVSGADFRSPGARILLTATGYVENTDMGWNKDRTSVGTKWGDAPVVCEGIGATIRIPGGAKIAALDETGAPRQEIESKAEDGATLFEIGPRWKTLWYGATR